jgi:2-keto-3-deoxy-6-phosphogluconate aldolase
VRIEEIAAYLQLGVKVVGLTGSLFSAEALANKNMDVVRQNAARAAQVAAAVGAAS